MRFRLRTLLIVLALGPPVLAGAWFAWPYAATLVEMLAIPTLFVGSCIALRYRLRTRLTLATVGAALLAFGWCPLLDSFGIEWPLDFDPYDVSRLLTNGFFLASLACSIAGFAAALASEERIPAQFWIGHFAATAIAVLLWFLTLPWIQAARE